MWQHTYTAHSAAGRGTFLKSSFSRGLAAIKGRSCSSSTAASSRCPHAVVRRHFPAAGLSRGARAAALSRYFTGHRMSGPACSIAFSTGLRPYRCGLQDRMLNSRCILPATCRGSTVSCFGHALRRRRRKDRSRKDEEGQESTPPCKPVLQCTGLGLQHAAFGGPIQGAWSYRAGRVGSSDLTFKYWPRLAGFAPSGSSQLVDGLSWFYRFV